MITFDSKETFDAWLKEMTEEASKPYRPDPTIDQNTCTHSHRIGNSEGETCAICGKVLAGYGAFRPYPKQCIHLWSDEPSAKMKVCIFCERFEPNEKYDPNYKPDD